MFPSFLLSTILTSFLIPLTKHFNILDKPDKKRKFHAKSTPLLGGVAVFLSFFIVLFLNLDKILSGNLNINHWLGFFAGALILMIGGFLDDKYKLSPRKQIIFPFLAVLALVAGGVNIEKITNPLGGLIYINSFVSFLIIFIWLNLAMYSTKLLDGVDGLVSGIGAIGALIIYFFTSTEQYYQGDIAFASLVFFGACLGFLLFNWHPAKIFLGEGGSLFIGYTLGVLSIISGAKIAIALLVMGLPMLDLFWVIWQRYRRGENPFKISDRKHLHFRLIDKGMGEQKTVLFFYFVSFVFGTLSLFLQSKGKIILLAVLVFLMFLIVYLLNKDRALKILINFMELFLIIFKQKEFRPNSRQFFVNRFLKFYLLFSWMLFILILISFPMPEYAGDKITYYDKAVHAFLFGALFYLSAIFLKTYKKLKNKSVLTISLLFTLSYSLFCEYIQIYVPGRDASELDFYAGVAGSVLVLLVMRRRKNKF